MPPFLYRIQATRLGMLTGSPTEHETAVVGEHFEYLQSLVAQGLILLAGRTLNADDRCLGIVILAAGSEQAVSRRMQNDPAGKQDLMRSELFPFSIAQCSPKGPGGTPYGR